MGEVIEQSDGPLPGECCICGREDDEEGAVTWEVVEEYEQLRDGEWYLHLFEVGEVTHTNVLKDVDVYLFCPDCAPDEPLPTADERPDFDMDVFIERWREELGVDK